MGRTNEMSFQNTSAKTICGTGINVAKIARKNNSIPPVPPGRTKIIAVYSVKVIARNNSGMTRQSQPNKAA